LKEEGEELEKNNLLNTPSSNNFQSLVVEVDPVVHQVSKGNNGQRLFCQDSDQYQGNTSESASREELGELRDTMEQRYSELDNKIDEFQKNEYAPFKTGVFSKFNEIQKVGQERFKETLELIAKRADEQTKINEGQTKINDGHTKINDGIVKKLEHLNYSE